MLFSFVNKKLFWISFFVCVSMLSCATKKEDKNLYEDLKALKPVNQKKEKEVSKEKEDENIGAFEVKGVWISTAYNLDWPRRAISTEADAEREKKELIKILDNLKSDGYNTIFFQVRTSLGVCYPSDMEPWANTMFKEGGVAYFDPTEFALSECHKRGLKFHAWFVTYPLGGKRSVRFRHLYKELNKYPNITVLHRNTWYLDPGKPQAREYLASVIDEAVSKYDFDGVHLDYIRYPENVSTFPDKATYAMYGNGEGLNAWRRSNVTKTVELINNKIKARNKNIILSVAPLGKLRQLPVSVVGRNHGWTAYESVMQDPVVWAKNKYVDWVVPMMYYRDALFSPFLDDWMKSVGKYCPVIAGLAPYRIVTESRPLWSISDITDQIDECKAKGVNGVAMFRYRFVSDSYPSIRFGIKKELQEGN